MRMYPAILIICGLFASGLILLVWSIRDALQRRSQGLRERYFVQKIEGLGGMLVYASLFASLEYALLHVSFSERLWITGGLLIGGLLLSSLAIKVFRMSKKWQLLSLLIIHIGLFSSIAGAGIFLFSLINPSLILR